MRSSLRLTRPKLSGSRRDSALSSEITRINGIAIGGSDIFDFYQANIIGGTNSFLLQAYSFDNFETAIATKIGAEIGAPAPERTEIPESGMISMLGLGFLTIGFGLRRRTSQWYHHVSDMVRSLTMRFEIKAQHRSPRSSSDRDQPPLST
ncbi:MAG: DUF1194 domain-containing protein [Geminicoccales bacterium]